MPREEISSATLSRVLLCQRHAHITIPPSCNDCKRCVSLPDIFHDHSRAKGARAEERKPELRLSSLYAAMPWNANSI